MGCCRTSPARAGSHGSTGKSGAITTVEPVRLILGSERQPSASGLKSAGAILSSAHPGWVYCKQCCDQAFHAPVRRWAISSLSATSSSSLPCASSRAKVMGPAGGSERFLEVVRGEVREVLRERFSSSMARGRQDPGSWRSAFGGRADSLDNPATENRCCDARSGSPPGDLPRRAQRRITECACRSRPKDHRPTCPHPPSLRASVSPVGPAGLCTHNSGCAVSNP
jgi:hypothetical protein